MSAAVCPMPVHSQPQPHPLSRSSTPTLSNPRHSRPTTPTPMNPMNPAIVQRIKSRPCTPPPLLSTSSHLNGLQPISAPPTPVNPTHLIPIAMERCRSSEATLTRSSDNNDNERKKGVPVDRESEGGRDGRSRNVKATSLLFQGLPNAMEVSALEMKNAGENSNRSSPMINATIQDEDDKMDVDEIEVDVPPPADEQFKIYGMPKWGWEEERKEVRPGVRLVGMEELPGLVEQHALIDTPSHVLFPWLHGICDDGKKGADMGAFFGCYPPFEPPAYRGLCILSSPPHPLDTPPAPPRHRPQVQRTDSEQTTQMPARDEMREPRERSETMSTSSESYFSSGTTEATSPSIGDWKDLNSPSSVPAPMSPESDTGMSVTDEGSDEGQDVQMHPCESKRASLGTSLTESDLSVSSPALVAPALEPENPASTFADSSSSSSESEEEAGPSCILLNSLHAQDIFELPKYGTSGKARFRQARLPQQINLRNLNIQQIKYATISDIILYAKNGCTNGVLAIAEQIAEAQEDMYQARMKEFYSQQSRGEGEGLSHPIRYGVWVVVEPFDKVQKHCPQLINVDANGGRGLDAHFTDLFEREARESRAMTRGSEVVEGFWVGNDCDVPGGADDGAGARVSFDLCVRASECCDMPSTGQLNATSRRLYEMDKRKSSETKESGHAWVPSPATVALRNLLSPSSSPNSLPDSGSGNKRTASPTLNDSATRPRRPRRSNTDEDYVSLDCAGSCRTITGHMRNMNWMTDRVVEFVYFLRKMIEGRDKSGRKRRVLVHCQDGYTESSIIVLAYIMSSLSISLPEAFLHLQLQAKRSFFLYPSDKPLLRKVDARLAADRRAKAIKLVSNSPPQPSSPVSPTRWKHWGLPFGKSGENLVKEEAKKTVEVARDLLAEEDEGGSPKALEARAWFDDRRFDGFPSRILPFLYLGNLEHAGNARMLKAIGITHVVSVGESLINCPPDCDPLYGHTNTLCAAARNGEIKVLDLTDIRDDGNDPLRHLIARACAWIEAARQEGGCVLVHCRVGVSRSASIVIAYLMQYQRMGLMDAYLLTRARRLNVLIQPNLRFFHELFGWEVELAKKEAAEAEENQKRGGGEIEMDNKGVGLGVDMTGGQGGGIAPRKIIYSWPAFCRDLYCLNRRFLCN